MSKPTVPQDAAPPYDGLYHHHAQNQPSQSTQMAYASVIQADLDDNNHNNRIHHNHDEESNLLMAPANLDATTPHFHCGVCERLQERREKRQSEKCCCYMVTLTFIVALIVIGSVVGYIVAPVGRRRG